VQNEGSPLTDAVPMQEALTYPNRTINKTNTRTILPDGKAARKEPESARASLPEPPEGCERFQVCRGASGARKRGS